MKRLSLLLATVSLAVFGLAATAHAEFGFSSFSNRVQNAAGDEETQAGAHPYSQTVSFELNAIPHPLFGEPVSEENPRDITIDLPLGFAGDPTGASTCTTLQVTPAVPRCPVDSQVGIAVVTFASGFSPPTAEAFPVYNMERAPGQLTRLAFNPGVGAPINVGVSIRSESDYGIRASLVNVSEGAPFISSRFLLWGTPADPSHDAQRGGDWHCLGDPFSEPGTCVGGGRSVSSPARAFLTNPTSCGGPLRTTIESNSWQHPEVFAHDSYTTASGITGCDKLQFNPSIAIQPTTTEADTPTGLHVDLTVPQNTNPNGLQTAHVKRSLVTLPEGMTVNPAAADGLGACSSAQFAQHSDAAPACPNSSVLGTMEIDTPVLEGPMKGTIYQAAQNDNPFGSNLALYTYAQGGGVTVKLAAKIHPDPKTGRLVTDFDNDPQLPFEDFKLDFKSGPRAALRTPSTCGTHTATDQLTSWADPGNPVTVSSSFDIASGPNGTPCSDTLAQRPNRPSLAAGTVNPVAGAFSPFVLKLSREDGSQELKGLSVTLPPGMIGRLAGIPYCPDSALAAAPGRRGAAELASPSCPAASLLGAVEVGAGAGTNPLYVGGRAYLAGPYRGAPLSLAIITPALAGPLDLGTVAVRVALRVDPATTQITAVSDPIPHILDLGGDGFPLDLRSIYVAIDRPNFTLNPTSCDPMAVSAVAIGSGGDLDSAADDTVAGLSNRFQVGSCGALDFKPKLSLRLKGATKRSGHPALRATLTMPKGGANIARAQVTLPHSEFLDQAHIKTVCTRVQYAAGGGGGEQCPAGSVYGHARAITPLLDKPLEGPVYLRSSSHKLPDLVASLGGQIHVDLDGRIGTGKGGGIRTTFDLVPDAPVSKFVLEMQGGKKGLLVNSTNLCQGTHRATALFYGQNGKIYDTEPVLQAKLSIPAQSCG